jgi:hypothetical protein
MQVDVFKLVLHLPSSPKFEKSLLDILRHDNFDKAVKLFALDRLFDDISIIVGNSPQSNALLILDLFQQYSLLMTEVATDNSPWEAPWLRVLFQFKKDGVHIANQPGTFLFDGFQTSGATHDSGGRILLGNFVRYKRRLILDRLSTRTAEEEHVFASLSLFNPYTRFFPDERNVGDHPGSRQKNKSWFNDRIRVHMKRILILDNLHRVNSNSVSMGDQRRVPTSYSSFPSSDRIISIPVTPDASYMGLSMP